jgi:hypothetical protein
MSVGGESAGGGGGGGGNGLLWIVISACFNLRRLQASDLSSINFFVRLNRFLRTCCDQIIMPITLSKQHIGAF